MKVHKAISEEKKYTKKLIWSYKRRYRKNVLQSLAKEFFLWAANVARQYEERFGDRKLGRIGHPT